MPKYPENMRDIISETIRNNIYQAGIELIRESGWQSFTTEKIAERLGVSRGVLYNYYKNKEAIAHSIIEISMEKLIQKLEYAAGDSASAEERLRKMAEITVSEFLQQREMHRAFMENLPPPSPHKEDHPIIKWHQKKDAVFERVIEDGVVSGEFHSSDPLQATTLLVGGLHEMCIKSTFSNQELKVDILIDIFLKGIKK